ncbi:hypothetical protein BJY01DRAFT_249241 [Aspergillus pseudoustus]|uniref:Cyanovirin-N domain-containing protein n=1 Tax=Aspergillus pseudoustus TaxID=1810923 RepID=A0ABR4JQ86_9EURO
MRFLFLTVLMTLLAAMASAVHTVHCAGRAIAATQNGLIKAISFLRIIEESGLTGPHGTLPAALRLEAHSCGEVYCNRKNKIQIRWCNDAIERDCLKTYKGEKVAGGVVDHPDMWSLIVQNEENAC